jgi:hypothetical protein
VELTQSVRTPQRPGIWQVGKLRGWKSEEWRVLTVKPVSSLRMGRILPSGSVNSSSRALTNRLRSSSPRFRPRTLSDATIPPIPTRLKVSVNLTR